MYTSEDQASYRAKGSLMKHSAPGNRPVNSVPKDRGEENAVLTAPDRHHPSDHGPRRYARRNNARAQSTTEKTVMNTEAAPTSRLVGTWLELGPHRQG